MIDFTNTRLTGEGVQRYYQLAKDYPFKFASLTRPQADMARIIGTTVPDKNTFLATSGNGSGKSAFGVGGLIPNIVFGNVNIYRDIVDLDDGTTFPGFFDYPLFNNFPASWPKKIWYVSNAELLKTVWEEFEFWIPDSLYTAHKDFKGYISRVHFKGTKWTLFFKTIDQDPKTFEGANVSLIIFDEPPPENLYTAGGIRLRKGGFIVMPATPLFGAGYFSDIIEDSLNENSSKVHQKVSCWSNCIERAGEWDLGVFGVQKKGNLRERFLQIGLDNCDPEEKAAREDGELMHFSGAVYKQYNRDIHFKKIDELEQIDAPHTFMYQFIIDPHDRRPPAAAWIRIDQWLRKRVIREWPSTFDEIYNHFPYHKIKSAAPFIMEDFVRFFISIFRDEIGVPPERVQAIIDPNSGRKPNDRTGFMTFEEYEQEFRKQGYPLAFVTNVVDSLEDGHKKVKDFLKPSVDGDLRLMVDKSCTNIDYQLRHYTYLDFEGKAAETKGIREGAVSEKFKDFPDLLRYACMCPVSWQPLERKIYKYSGGDYEEVDSDDWRSKVGRPVGAAGV
ncbi:MAG: hypothetical protein H8D67_26650 [Deltaproteobacteria bacterium]|nr:hypothetical protein [Deltaproteobacteria bacterium]